MNVTSFSSSTALASVNDETQEDSGTWRGSPHNPAATMPLGQRCETQTHTQRNQALSGESERA